MGVGLNSIYLIMNIHIDLHTMLCETGSGSKHKAYIEAISCIFEGGSNCMSVLPWCLVFFVIQDVTEVYPI